MTKSLSRSRLEIWARSRSRRLRSRLHHCYCRSHCFYLYEVAYGRQWFRVIFMRYCLVPTSVTNCSYNKYTKS